jgi:hypothetical protein
MTHINDSIFLLLFAEVITLLVVMTDIITITLQFYASNEM